MGSEKNEGLVAARESITPDMSVKDLLLLMSEGNPGALSVLTQLQADLVEMIEVLFHLDDMNIRGEQVYLAYKFVKSDIKKFVDCVINRNPNMVEYVNSQTSCGHAAVVQGASFERSRCNEKRV